MQRANIPLYQPHLEGNVHLYVNECLTSTWISSKGPFIGRFEKAFANYVGATHAATCCNGTVALHLALMALGLAPGDEVLVPTLTYVASANAIRYVGATPVFVDADPVTLQLDVNDLESKISPRTKAVLAVHLYGYACELDALRRLCQARKLFLIEDCAEALGTTYQGQHVGTFGDISTFSFFGNKTITTGEGGMVVTNQRHLHEKVCLLKGQGVSPTRTYWHEIVGYNYRMTNICAAIGLAQLEQVEAILERKRAIARTYRKRLPYPLHDPGGDVEHSFWLCSILLSERDALRAHLSTRGIETRPFFVPLHLLPPYADCGMHLPVAEALAKRGMNLPSFPGLGAEPLEFICAAIEEFAACTISC